MISKLGSFTPIEADFAVHQMPKAFGKVGWVIFDESPLDVFMFGVERNDEIVLALDDLQPEAAEARLKAKQLKLWGVPTFSVDHSIA